MNTPEHELVLACVRVDDRLVGRVAAVLRQGLDWEAVWASARQQRVLPLLYYWLEKNWVGSVPESEMAPLRAIYQANTLRSLRLARRLVQLVDLLSGEGIDCLSFKGPVLAQQIYNDIALRQSTDLDILVRKADLPRAFAVLSAAGYVPEIPPGTLSPAQLARVNKHLEFQRGEDRVELHGEIMESGMVHPISPDFFWQDAPTILLLDRPVRTLSPEANLLMLAMQAAGDGWDILKWPADLARACQWYPPRDWDAFLAGVRGKGFARMVHLALLLAVELGGASLPPAVLAQCQADRAARALAQEGILRLSLPQYRPVSGLVLYLRARERLRDRLYYVLDQSFVPKQVDWLTFRLPAWLSPAYYLLRPLRLAVKFTGAALRRARDSRADGKG